MKNCRVIIVSTSPLFVDAVSRLLNEEQIQVVAAANDLDEAQSSLSGQTIASLVVDNDDTNIDTIKALTDFIKTRLAHRVVFLSLSNNQIIIHYQERIENITPSDLIKAICFSKLAQ